MACVSLLLLFRGVRGFSATDTMMLGPTSANSSWSVSSYTHTHTHTHTHTLKHIQEDRLLASDKDTGNLKAIISDTPSLLVSPSLSVRLTYGADGSESPLGGELMIDPNAPLILSPSQHTLQESYQCVGLGQRLLQVAAAGGFHLL